MKSLCEVMLQSKEIITSQRAKKFSNVRISEDGERHCGLGDGIVIGV